MCPQLSLCECSMFNATLFSFVMINIFIETYILHSARLFIMLIRKANLTLYKDRGRKKCCYVNLTHTWMCIITPARGQKCWLPIGQWHAVLAPDWLMRANTAPLLQSTLCETSWTSHVKTSWAKLQTNLWGPGRNLSSFLKSRVILLHVWYIFNERLWSLMMKIIGGWLVLDWILIFSQSWQSNNTGSLVSCLQWDSAQTPDTGDAVADKEKWEIFIFFL